MVNYGWIEGIGSLHLTGKLALNIKPLLLGLGKNIKLDITDFGS